MQHIQGGVKLLVLVCSSSGSIHVNPDNFVPFLPKCCGASPGCGDRVLRYIFRRIHRCGRRRRTQRNLPGDPCASRNLHIIYVVLGAVSLDCPYQQLKPLFRRKGLSGRAPVGGRYRRLRSSSRYGRLLDSNTVSRDLLRDGPRWPFAGRAAKNIQVPPTALKRS